MKKLSRTEFADNFAKNIERDRVSIGLSQEEMAKELDMSLSAYKRIINGETTRIDMYTSYLVYMLVRKMTFEMVDYTDDVIKATSKLRYLKPNQLKILTELVDVFLEENKC